MMVVLIFSIFYIESIKLKNFISVFSCQPKMSFKQMSVYESNDVYINKNDVEPLGFDKNKSLGEMINIAIQHHCCVIVKAGKNAKWYLKGQHKNYEKTKKNWKILQEREYIKDKQHTFIQF
jgi:hypothetical protein